jgi:uncharacterized protein
VADRLIVDAHLHLYRTPAEGEQGKTGYEIWEYGSRPDTYFSSASGDLDSAQKEMAAAGAGFAVVPNLLDVRRAGVALVDDLADFNQWLCDVARGNPRFIPLVAVEPAKLGVEATVAEVERLVSEWGAAGIKLHPPLMGLDLFDPSVLPLFELCRRLDVVVLSHSGPSRQSTGTAEPDAFRPVLESVPGLRIVIAHLGGAAWHQTAGLARDFPEVRFDLCEIIEWLGAPNAPTPREAVDLIREIGVDRVLFGSDFPWYDIAHSVAAVEGLPGLSTEERDAILGANAATFFRLPA